MKFLFFFGFKGGNQNEKIYYPSRNLLVESTPALFAGIVCFVVAAAIKGFFRKAGK